jgi:hypothetical protein
MLAGSPGLDLRLHKQLGPLCIDESRRRNAMKPNEVDWLKAKQNPGNFPVLVETGMTLSIAYTLVVQINQRDQTGWLCLIAQLIDTTMVHSFQVGLHLLNRLRGSLRASFSLFKSVQLDREAARPIDGCSAGQTPVLRQPLFPLCHERRINCVQEGEDRDFGYLNS